MQKQKDCQTMESGQSEAIAVQLLKESVLTLGDIQLDCAIANDPEGKPLRLLRQKRVAEALGTKGSRHRLVQSIIAYENVKNYVTDDLKRYLQVYTWKSSRGMAPKAYRAELLPELCDLYLCAQDADVLLPHQHHIARRCYQMMRAFAKVGIIALVDEVTGFQEQRAKDELRQLYDHFLVDIPTPWREMFHKQYWEGAFALYGRPYHPQRHPACMMSFVSKSVYRYVPPPLYEAVKDRNPVVDEHWRRAYKHHPFFTEGPGKELLMRQIERVMHAGYAVDWKQSRRAEFWEVLNRICLKGKVVQQAWDVARQDQGWAGLPLFGGTVISS